MSANNNSTNVNSNNLLNNAVIAPNTQDAIANMSTEELHLQLSLLRTQFVNQHISTDAKHKALKQEYCRLEEQQSSLQQQLKIRRASQAHFDNIAAFWQENTVSVSNKLVAVPRHLLFSDAAAAIKNKNIDKLIRIESTNSGESTETSLSGRSRSSSGDQKQHKKTTTFVERFREEVDQDCKQDCEQPCEMGPCGTGAGVQLAF